MASTRRRQKHVAHLAATAIVSLTEAKLGIHDIRHYVHSRALRYLGHVFRMDADRTPSLLQRCWVVDGKQPSGKTKDLYDSAVQKLLDEVAQWGSASLMPLTRASGIT